MRLIHAACWFLLLPPPATWAGEPPVDQDGQPRIKKLGTIDVDKVENAPIVFRGKLYRCEWSSTIPGATSRGLSTWPRPSTKGPRNSFFAAGFSSAEGRSPRRTVDAETAGVAARSANLGNRPPGRIRAAHRDARLRTDSKTKEIRSCQADESGPAALC